MVEAQLVEAVEREHEILSERLTIERERSAAQRDSTTATHGGARLLERAHHSSLGARAVRIAIARQPDALDEREINPTPTHRRGP
ncbi:MAG: hypothetical protein KC468_13035 [Myxococcales bacterium]|nr:hypothetical protein [Myxococcales bacterium]